MCPANGFTRMTGALKAKRVAAQAVPSAADRPEPESGVAKSRLNCVRHFRACDSVANMVWLLRRPGGLRETPRSATPDRSGCAIVGEPGRGPQCSRADHWKGKAEANRVRSGLSYSTGRTRVESIARCAKSLQRLQKRTLR